MFLLILVVYLYLTYPGFLEMLHSLKVGERHSFSKFNLCIFSSHDALELNCLHLLDLRCAPSRLYVIVSIETRVRGFFVKKKEACICNMNAIKKVMHAHFVWPL